MRALVVYESMFGSNRDLARVIADGLAVRVAADVVEVGSAPTELPMGLDLLVVGGPNHQFGLSRPSSRETAAKETATGLVSSREGLREWLEALQVEPGTLRFAVFDTRLDNSVLRRIDRAARTVTKHLRHLGLDAIADSESFRVLDMKGPLAEGELERARRWGVQLAALVSQTPVA